MTTRVEETAPGPCPAADQHDRKQPEADLFSPLTLRGMTLPNRVVMSPMCQYVATDGLADDWHLVHIGSRAAGGVGLVIVEATSVTPDGRITPGDLGVWGEQHVGPLARIVRFVHSQGKKAGLQLAHAGRKASCDVPWRGGGPLPADRGGWPVVGPSPVPFGPGSPVPHALDDAGIGAVLAAFEAAAARAVRAGFDVVEIHAAHGYLLHSFLSPLANRREDRYGGGLENRCRLVVETARRVRAVLPEAMPLFVRVSATDWADGGWDLPQTVALARMLKGEGVDLIDVSSGGMVPVASIPVAKGYQVPLAAAVRREACVPTGAVGLILEPAEANDVVCRGDADLVFLGRQLLREPYWGLRAAAELDAEADWPVSYGYAVRRRPRPT